VFVSARVEQRFKGDDGLLAVSTVILDIGVTIRDVKVVRVEDGVTVIMPFRKLTARCPRCSYAGNFLRNRFCGGCGAVFSYRGRAPVTQDVVTLTPEVKDKVRKAVMVAYLAPV